MKFILERTVDPDIEPILLAEMKAHLRVTDTDNDTLITGLITGAREWVEDYTGRALIDQTWRLTLAGKYHGYIGGDSVGGYRPGYYTYGAGTRDMEYWIRGGEILLRKAPALSLISFKSVDNAGVETAIDAAYYQLREIDSKWPRIVPLNGATWPACSDLRIVYRAGFADRDSSPQQDGAAVPFRFKQAMKLWAEANYDRDDKTMQLYLDTAELLIKSERSEMGMA
jgi:hypothetical protein